MQILPREGKVDSPIEIFPGSSWRAMALVCGTILLITQVPDNFNAMQALRIIGYNIQDSASAVFSFKLHFIQADSSKMITEPDKKILFDLMKKYQ